MKPQASAPWRKTIRAEAKGEPRHRAARNPEPARIRRGSTWIRRHLWMPADERHAIHAERVR